MIFALVDCNNFYVSCERVFNPDLEGKPLIILSNNDGCVISRSAEAKALGIAMGVPAFEILPLLEREKVHIFSSNYTLYGDLSQRVMSILSQLSPDIEIYSVDEAFLRIDHMRRISPEEYGKRIREVLWKHLGIPVSVGIGKSKTLAKAANFLAKKDPSFHGVMDLSSSIDIDKYLESVPVEEVWGIGSQYGQWLHDHGFRTAKDFKYAGESLVRQQMKTPGLRSRRELWGLSCIPLEQIPPARKALCTSRSYGRPTQLYEDIEAATATFTARTAEKLRKGKLLAGRFTVFVMTNRFARGPRYVNFLSSDLSVPTNDTAELMKIMTKMLRKIYRKGYLYKKSGVLAEQLVPESARQLALWDENSREKMQRLSLVVDNLNVKLGRDKVRYALQGFDRRWKMRQEKLSKAYTTSWDDILNIDI